MDYKTIGRYEIVGELGHGAMGSVLRARDPVMSRVVAIKAIHAASLAGGQAAEFRERFYREARAAGALSHPGIVPVFDVGEDNGAPYLVMELVQGRTLDAVLKAGERYSLDRVCQIGQQIADALGFAHRNGVIHRDIKPANILMTSREVYGTERPRITDFGVAKLAGGEMTTTGQLLGTPAFMPPEQFTGAPIDGRTDLFALGVILYRMTTGEQPFPGETLTAVSYKIVHTEPIPPSKLNPAVPAIMESVILKCLAKNPTERYQTGEELSADLSTVRATALGANAHATVSQTHPIMDSGASETIDQISSLRPKPGSGQTMASTMPTVASQFSTGTVHSQGPPAESSISTMQGTVFQAPAETTASQPAAAQPAKASAGAKPKNRTLLAVMWVGVAIAAVVGTRMLMRIHVNDKGEPTAAVPAQPPAPPAPVEAVAETPASPQPPTDVTAQPVNSNPAQPVATPRPATGTTAKPAAGAPQKPAAAHQTAGAQPTPAPAQVVAAPVTPPAQAPTVASRPAVSQSSLDPNTSGRLKMNLDGFSAELTITIQMDGKVLWSGLAGDQKAGQGLLVAPGSHEFRVTVRGQHESKSSNTVNGDFAAKKRMTLSVKLRPQAIGGSTTIDPSAQVTASLKKDLFQF